MASIQLASVKVGCTKEDLSFSLSFNSNSILAKPSGNLAGLKMQPFNVTPADV